MIVVVKPLADSPTWDVAWDTSVMTTVPRIPATAFGVRISICSPGFIRSFTTARAILPPVTSRVAVCADSLMVNAERSRTVTTALPPSRMRASALSPVTMRSATNTSSRCLSGIPCGTDTRVSVAEPCNVVTMPTRASCASAPTVSNVITVSASRPTTRPVLIGALPGSQEEQQGCQRRPPRDSPVRRTFARLPKRLS